MHPRIDSTEFGSITIDGSVYDHDVIFRLNGRVKKRKKKLSKEVYGTSHIVSLEEARHIYGEGAKRLIIGAGHDGMLKLSDEAKDYFQKKECTIVIKPTPAAALEWNKKSRDTIGMFHVTC